MLASDGDLALAAKDVVVVVASVAACDGAGNVGCWCCWNRGEHSSDGGGSDDINNYNNNDGVGIVVFKFSIFAY